MSLEDSITDMLADEDARQRARHARHADERRSTDDELMEGIARQIEDGFTVPLPTFTDEMLASIW